MMSQNTSRVLIIGGGFSGLAAAIMLSREGTTVDLIERAPEWAMDGAGISIGPASMRALHRIGAHDRFLAAGAGCDGTELRDPTGHLITTFPTPRLVHANAPGNGAIMRPLLGQILVDLAIEAGVNVRLGTTATSLDDLGDRVRATLSDGHVADYNLVVAADGLYSQTRTQVLPDSPSPAYSGQGAWRAVVPRPAEVTRTIVWVGGAVKVGVNPISDDEMYVFVNESSTERERIADADLLPRLRDLLAPFTDPVLTAARAALGEDALVLYRPMDNLLVPLPWHHGRIVLIGDAVHATTPHLAAGAGIGLEDGIALAEELAISDDIEMALQSFEERRYDRCRMVIEDSAELGKLELRTDGGTEFAALQANSNRSLAEPF